ncbi:FAD-dependent monooxygenase [Pacificimonas sp. WHA3]|uniref:FAD-dependent monooxygenase n=1 Tax=Pacificimonas pallii TaxID=2827236 RepID=A0ABS6SBV8_9SPHN|nr:FAD-dependent monooxygenase [Pacificimonas pallii]MBV7255573.1 FAD-dependent monooxygenase [Pacificimonas pallii]
MSLDQLVIGGGPAGAMLAAGLAQQGKSVTLLEGTGGAHHKVCGEFLSWEACAALRGEGVDIDGLDGAPIDRLRMIHGDRAAETHLPGTALGISRYRLDEALLSHAAARGARVRRGTMVRAFEGGQARLSDGDVLAAARTWLATGKRELRGTARAIGAQAVTDGLTGFKLHVRLAPADRDAIARTIELHRFGGGYAGLQPIEDGKANLCLLAKEEIARGGWDGVRAHLALSAPRLFARLDRAEALFEKPLAIARVPYGFVSNAAQAPVRIGDQLAVIHSFTGDGMAIAITSGIAAARLSGHDDAHLMRQLARRTRGPVARAAWIYAHLSEGGFALRTVQAFPWLARQAARFTRVELLKKSKGKPL